MRLKRFAPVLVVAVALIGCAENANPTAPSVTPEPVLKTARGPVGDPVGGPVSQADAEPTTLVCGGPSPSHPLLEDHAMNTGQVLRPGTTCAVTSDGKMAAVWSDPWSSFVVLFGGGPRVGGVFVSDELTVYGSLYKCNSDTPGAVWHGASRDDVDANVIVIECAGAYVEPPPPPPVTCGDGEELVNGVCVVPPPPPPVTCGDGEELVNGVCVVPPPPPPVTCDDGEELVNGVCVVPPPPPPVTCDDGEELVNGVCVVPPPPPPVTCGDGEELVNGVCVVVPPPPPPLTCDEGEEIVNGVCVVVPPLPMTCDDGEEVVDGVCVVIPPPPPPAVFVSPLSCNADPNANSVLDEQSRHDGLPCAVSDDGKLRALRMSGGTIAVQSELDTNVIRSSVEMRKGDQTIPGATAVFWCIANADGSIWHTTETAATTVIVECAD